jgi:hypothetical protein
VIPGFRGYYLLRLKLDSGFQGTDSPEGTARREAPFCANLLDETQNGRPDQAPDSGSSTPKNTKMFADSTSEEADY